MHLSEIRFPARSGMSVLETYGDDEETSSDDSTSIWQDLVSGAKELLPIAVNAGVATGLLPGPKQPVQTTTTVGGKTVTTTVGAKTAAPGVPSQKILGMDMQTAALAGIAVVGVAFLAMKKRR